MVGCCERDAEGERAPLQQGRGRMDLGINPEKPRVVAAREGVNFLGHRIRYERSRTGKRGCSQWPNPRAQQRRRDRWREILRPPWNARADTVIPLLNPVTRGWGAYFRRSNAGPPFHAMDPVRYTRRTRGPHRQHRRKVRYREDSRAFWEHLGGVFPTGLLRSGRLGR